MVEILYKQCYTDFSILCEKVCKIHCLWKKRDSALMFPFGGKRTVCVGEHIFSYICTNKVWKKVWVRQWLPGERGTWTSEGRE